MILLPNNLTTDHSVKSIQISAIYTMKAEPTPDSQKLAAIMFIEVQ